MHVQIHTFRKAGDKPIADFRYIAEKWQLRYITLEMLYLLFFVILTTNWFIRHLAMTGSDSNELRRKLKEHKPRLTRYPPGARMV